MNDEITKAIEGQTIALIAYDAYSEAARAGYVNPANHKAILRKSVKVAMEFVEAVNAPDEPTPETPPRKVITEL